MNISMSLGYPNGTFKPLVHDIDHATISPSYCQDDTIQAAIPIKLDVPGNYTVIWQQMISFPKFANTTTTPMMCWGGSTSTEASDILRTFVVEEADTSVSDQPTIAQSDGPLYMPTHNITATWSPQPTGKLYFISYSSSTRTMDEVRPLMLISAVLALAAGLLLEITRL